jgi:hypothetical protein
VALGGGDGDIKTNFGEWTGGFVVDSRIRVRTKKERLKGWASAVGNAGNDAGGFGGECGGRVDDLCGFEDVAVRMGLGRHGCGCDSLTWTLSYS